MQKFLPLLLTAFVSASAGAQGLYDLSTIQTIEITFAESNWDQLLDQAYATTEDYILAQSVTVNGVTMDSVGVKYKGNSTYQANQTKNPFHIELDTYKDHIYDGYTDIKLSNVAKDPSFVREVLSYQIARQYMDAPLSNYANVYVNGELIGLYSNSESISRKFVDKYYGSKDNTRVKCNPPAGAGQGTTLVPDLQYRGEDSSAYYAAYELKSDNGWSELIDLCDTLANHIDAIDQILDVDRALWMLAFDNVLVNLDSYIGSFAQNYYLYRDDYGRFLPTVWDLNESFGVFSDSGTIRYNSTNQKAQMSHLLHENDAAWPLMSQLMSVPQYKRKYLAHVKTMLQENFSNGTYEQTAIEFQSTIDEAVQADDNKFFTYANFTSNLNSDIGGGPGGGGPGAAQTPGITSLMDARASYLLGLSDFTQTEPVIDAAALSNPTPDLGETVTVTANVTDALRVYLNHRSVNGAPFEQIEMYDDGTHNDEAAGDGIYATQLLVSSPLTEYYFYAENDDIGKFAPQRAEHEFYEISIETTSSLAGDLVINEFMASNDTTQADQDGDFDDWIELYNNTSESISLDGFYLSDDAGNLTKWAFPAGTTIEGNGYLIVWADEDLDQDGLHADFKLSAGGETVLLMDANQAIVDSISYVDQETDISHGRFPNGTGDFQDMSPTFSAENTDQLPGGTDPGFTTSPLAGDLVVNEFMASNDTTMSDQDGDFDDWIELYNNTSESISLDGFYLSDDLGELTKWTFPAGTTIAGNGYLIIWADEDLDQDGLHADFKLSAGGETVVLSDANEALIDTITYADQETDISHGRYPNGTGDFMDMTPTFNAENSNGIVGTRYTPLVGADLTLYPNPTAGMLNVRLEEAYTNDLQFRLFATDGRLLRESVLNRGGITLEIDATNLPDGFYLLSLADGQAVETHKVVVRR
ncbi:T9SS type A sorting domain-containing protein [Neolewinella aurantiaca]|uniref:T9SS type A sorting domain-containing protein n=1 Tax=Neolewinella aurantiaca TaxID=2602767 RepID=A0A5C7FXM2_9BACT|nr:lamin tail domain-containing protein [Neolewinella aurantiaca]TXF90269.1 T9SS type A sorting domain-containing protein [Neolewinella aurantiaca]